MTFETDAGAVVVNAEEAIHFAADEFQLGVNRGDERVIALALGAPRTSEEIEYLRHCTQCGTRTIQTPSVPNERRGITIRCTECWTVLDVIPC